MSRAYSEYINNILLINLSKNILQCRRFLMNGLFYHGFLRAKICVLSAKNIRMYDDKLQKLYKKIKTKQKIT